MSSSSSRLGSPAPSSPGAGAHCAENGGDRPISPALQYNLLAPASSDEWGNGDSGSHSRAPTPQCLPLDDQNPEMEGISQDMIYQYMEIARCLVVEGQSRAATPCASPNIGSLADLEMEMPGDSAPTQPRKALEWPPAPYTLASALTLDEMPDSDLWYHPDYQVTEEWLEKTIKYLKEIDEEKRVAAETEVDMRAAAE